MKKLLFSLFLVAAMPAHADGTPINEGRPLKPDGVVRVNNLSGEITVTAWDRNDVEITGILGEGSEELRISGDRDALDIEVVLPRRARNVEASYLRLKVPAGASLELKGVSADLDVTGTRGALRLATVSGEITVKSDASRLRAESVSGDMEISVPSSDTELDSVSGDIAATRLTGRLEVSTVSGDIVVSGGAFSEFGAETVSGDVEFSAESLADGARVDLESVSGELTMNLPATLNAQVRLETFSGTIKSDHGTPNRGRDRLETTVGSGKGRIRADSHSGDIELRKR